MNRKHKILLTTGAALSLSGVAMGQSADLDLDRAYAAELKADASRHASLLQAGGSGYDGAFHIGDASGNNRLNVNALLQFRWIGNFTDDDDSSVVSESFTSGFETQHALLSFNGNVINPQVTYNISIDLGQANRDDGAGESIGTFGVSIFDSGGLSSILRDAWAQYNFEGEGSGFYARWGQFVVPILHEENVHAGKQQAVERGPVNEFFTPSWSEGIMVGYLADSFAIHGALTDGIRTPISRPTAWTNYDGEDADFAISARADVKFSGAWEQFDDFTSFRGSDSGFKVGGAFHFQTGGDTGRSDSINGTTLDLEYWMWTLDAQYEGDGWNIAAGYVGHTIDVADTAASLFSGLDVTNHGVYVQGGVFLADQWDLYARWDWLLLDEDFTGDEEDFHFVTVGTNYYFVPESHALKFTGDVIYALDESVGGLGNPNLGDTGLLLGTDGELALRLQLSLLF